MKANYETRAELIEGLKKMGIKQMRVHPEKGFAYEIPNLDNTKIEIITGALATKTEVVPVYSVRISKDDTKIEIDLKELINAAFDNSSYGGVAYLDYEDKY